MNRIVDAGYPYEIAGLVFYVFFLYMVRRSAAGRYSQRTRVLTIVTAIALVGVVPFHYAANVGAVGIMLLLGSAAVVSAFIDVRRTR